VVGRSGSRQRIGLDVITSIGIGKARNFTKLRRENMTFKQITEYAILKPPALANSHLEVSRSHTLFIPSLYLIMILIKPPLFVPELSGDRHFKMPREPHREHAMARFEKQTIPCNLFPSAQPLESCQSLSVRNSEFGCCHLRQSTAIRPRGVRLPNRQSISAPRPPLF
jgi:hypothetical protein